MRSLAALLLCLCLACFLPCSLAQGGDDILEENPRYTGSPTKGNTTKPKDLKPLDLKTALNRALASSRKVSPRKFVRRNRMKITLALAVVAFRRELGHFLWLGVSKPVVDPETGEVIRRRIQVSPTAVLKIILFIDFMFRWQTAASKKTEGDEGDESDTAMSPLAALLLLGSRRNPASALLLSKFLQATPSAYVPPVRQHYTFERVNERFKKDRMAFQKAIGPTAARAHAARRLPPSSKNTKTLSELLSGRSRLESSPKYNGTVIVVDMTEMDTSVTQMDVLRDQVSYLVDLHQASNEPTTRNVSSYENQFDEVVLLLESPGGSAADYSLASQQVLRLREQGINVTICVDKVAASGGYMVACTSSPGRLYAAPFAVLGSIGVLGQTFNIHERLENWGVKPLVFRGGKDKAPLGLVGPVTEEGIAKVQDMIDKTHRAFKRHVADCRPVIASEIEEIATGEIWLGHDALDLGLVDRVVTSDEYIGERLSEGACVLKLVQLIRPRYPFQQPRTATASQGKRNAGSVLSLFSDVRAQFERIVGGLGNYIISEGGEGLVSLGRASSATTLKSPQSSN